MSNERVTAAKVTRQTSGKRVEKPDLLAVEEPLEIRLAYGPEADRAERSIAVTMRTPGHDFELVLGFLFTEGIIAGYEEVAGIIHCENVKTEEERGNVVRVALKPSIQIDLKKINRNFYTTSSCGVCSKSSIEALGFYCKNIASDMIISEQMLLQAPEIMRKKQDVFEHTGGLHAAALFDQTGHMLLLREDIGRHNALDKLIGAYFAKGLLPLANHFIVVSGRLGFELVQKAIAAGVPVLGAVGAPSSLAVQLAQSYGVTVAGFVRNGSFNIYSKEERVK